MCNDTCRHEEENSKTCPDKSKNPFQEGGCCDYFSPIDEIGSCDLKNHRPNIGKKQNKLS